MKKWITTIYLVCCSVLVIGQETTDCSTLLSQAEQAYRDGKFDAIKDIYKCLGIRQIVDSTRIYPRRMKILVEELEKIDAHPIETLGAFTNFGSFLRSNAVHKSYENEITERLKKKISDKDSLESEIEKLKKETSFDHQIFNRTDNRKAYILLGQTYLQLGSYEHAKFFAYRLLKEYPTIEIKESEDYLYFKRVSDMAKKGIKRISLGIILGTNGTIPYPLTINVESKRNSFRFLGGISGGVQARYYFTENVSLGIGIVARSNRINLQGKLPDPKMPNSKSLNYKHEEYQIWLQLPITLRYVLETENKEHVPFDAKPFVNIGFSINHLAKSNSEVGTPNETRSSIPTRVARRHNNLEAIIGGGMRVRFGRSYLSLGLNLNYSLFDVQKSYILGSNEDPFVIFEKDDIRDNTYNIVTIGLQFGFEYRINLLPKPYLKSHL